MTDRARQEGVRRALHLATGLVGIAALRLPPRDATILVAGILLAALALDIARLRVSAASRLAERMLGGVYRPSERGRLSAATLLAAGFAAAWFAFPAVAAAPAMVVTAAADPAAAFAGTRWGGAPAGKSLAGTLAAGVVALAVLLVLSVALVPALAAAAAAALAERIPGRGVDNVAIPLATAGVLALLA